MTKQSAATAASTKAATAARTIVQVISGKISVDFAVNTWRNGQAALRPSPFGTPPYDVHRISRLATKYQSAGTSSEADLPIGVRALLGNKLGLLDRPVKQSDEAE